MELQILMQIHMGREACDDIKLVFFLVHMLEAASEPTMCCCWT